MEETEVVPERSVVKRASKSGLKVVVYTPLVTEPALPEMLPLMVLEKVLDPLKVLLFASKVVEAPVKVVCDCQYAELVVEKK